MTQPLLPRPEPVGDEHRQDDAQHRHDDQQDQHSHGGAKKAEIATEEECLAALSRLPALVALRMLTSAQANTIRSTYTAILQHHRQTRAKNESGGVPDDAMVDMLSRHPELANLLEPLLSAEQIASILARAKDGSRGPA